MKYTRIPRTDLFKGTKSVKVAALDDELSQKLLKAYAQQLLDSIIEQAPGAIVVGEAEALYFEPYYVLAMRAMETVTFTSEGAIVMATTTGDGYRPGCVIQKLMSSGATLNAASVYLSSLKTKSETDLLVQAEAVQKMIGTQVDDTTRTALANKVKELLDDATKLLKWISGPFTFQGSKNDTSKFDSDILKTVITLGGTGYIRDADIRSLPQVLAKRHALVNAIRTLLAHDVSFADGFALLAGYATYLHLTRTPEQYDTYFPRMMAGIPTQTIANQTRLAAQLGYHMLTTAYSPMSMIFHLNGAIVRHSYEFLASLVPVSPSTAANIKTTLETYDFYLKKFSFSALKPLVGKIVAKLKLLQGCEHIILSDLKALLPPLPATPKQFINLTELRHDILEETPYTSFILPNDYANQLTLVEAYASRVASTVAIIAGTLELTACAGASLDINALQIDSAALGIDKLPDDNFVYETICDAETLLKMVDTSSEVSFITAKLAPNVWTHAPNGKPLSLTTPIDLVTYKPLNFEGFTSQLILNEKFEVRYKWPEIVVPVASPTLTALAGSFIPFVYTEGFEVSFLTPKKMRRLMTGPMKMFDGAAYDGIDQGYALMRQADVLLCTDYADAWASLGILYLYSEKEKKFVYCSPTIPFAYGVHHAVYLKKMGLELVMTPDAMAEVVSKNDLNVFAYHEDSLDPEPFLSVGSKHSHSLYRDAALHSFDDSFDPLSTKNQADAQGADDDVNYHSESPEQKKARILEQLMTMPAALISYSHLPAPQPTVYATGVLSHKSYFPIPILASHFTSNIAEAAQETEHMLRFSTQWLFEKLNTCLKRQEVSGPVHLAVSKIADTITWVKHWAYSRRAVPLPHISFRTQHPLAKGSVAKDYVLNTYLRSIQDVQKMNDLPYNMILIHRPQITPGYFEFIESFDYKEKKIKIDDTIKPASVPSQASLEETVPKKVENEEGGTSLGEHGVPSTKMVSPSVGPEEMAKAATQIASMTNANSGSETTKIKAALEATGTMSSVTIPPTFEQAGGEVLPKVESSQTAEETL